MIIIDGTYPLPLVDGDRSAMRFKIEGAFRTDTMVRLALFAGSVHPRAMDYVMQAPVLALAVHAGGGALNGGAGNKAYSAHKFGQLCARGVRLREILAAYGLSLPLRRLQANALRSSHMDALCILSAVPSSTLAQVIPNVASRQDAWLARLAEWSRRLGAVYLAKLPPEWLASRSPLDLPVSAIIDVADFVKCGDVPINPAWSWARADAAMQDWHDRVSAGSAKAKFGVMANQVIDVGKHPDTAVVNGLEFVALRTPSAIHAEGQYMRHCVSTYVQGVVDGKFSIISVRRDERRLATLQLHRLRVSQLKARFNKAAPNSVQRAARAYAVGLRPPVTMESD